MKSLYRNSLKTIKYIKMKPFATLLAVSLIQTASLFAGNTIDTLAQQKQHFYEAKTELESMLSGKQPLDYERAVFLTENVYWNNQYDYSVYKSVIDFHVNNIKMIAEANRKEQNQNFKATIFETEEQKHQNYNNLLYNWAIFTYLTDTTIVPFVENSRKSLYFHLPYTYPVNDPMAVLNWSNSQTFNLLNNKSANCFAQTAFFKILSERLNTGANISLAPSHAFISHTNTKGTTYNIELPTRSFPGAGSIMTYTYTPVDAVRSGIAMRTLNDKQSIALCFVYLAKAFEHKFDCKTNDFIIQCAQTALQYDSLNLNAMLLKVEVLEEKIVHKHKTVVQLQLDKEFKEYQNLITLLYNKGYREMPLDMKNLIIDHLKKDSTNFILANHTPRGFQSINPKDDRYATLSWGKFDEVHEPKRIEQYQRTLFDTKTMKITKFVTADTLYNNYPFDPVIAAWQIDPLFAKYPSVSPYSAFANNPIVFIDKDGKEPNRYQSGTIDDFFNQFKNINNYKDKSGNLLKLDNVSSIYAYLKENSSTAIRYVYTEKNGWIDMNHVFSVFENGKTATDALEPLSGNPYAREYLFNGAGAKSYYSYEDLPSNKFASNINIYNYVPSTFGIGSTVQQSGSQLMSTIKTAFTDAGATCPDKAPNWNQIPANEDRTVLMDKSGYVQELTSKELKTGLYVPQNHSSTSYNLDNFPAAPTSLEKTTSN
jgi:hypothetical protein